MAFLFERDVDYDEIVQEVQVLLAELPGTNDLSVADIEVWNSDINWENDDDSDKENEFEGEENVTKPSVSYSEAVQSINTLIKYYENQDNAIQVASLINMRSDMVKNYTLKEKKQTHINGSHELRIVSCEISSQLKLKAK